MDSEHIIRITVKLRVEIEPVVAGQAGRAMPAEDRTLPRLETGGGKTEVAPSPKAGAARDAAKSSAKPAVQLEAGEELYLLPQGGRELTAAEQKNFAACNYQRKRKGKKPYSPGQWLAKRAARKSKK